MAGAADTPAREQALVLIDGEHYPPVVRATVEGLRERFEPVGALFLGGEEKLRDGCSDAAALADAYGLPVTVVAVPGAGGGAREAALGAGLARALAATPVTVLVDLSDEPVLGYRERFRLISVALAWGARYVGADFEFSPQPLARLSSKPSLVVIGTGKRVGKTAVGGYTARVLAQHYGGREAVAIVAMGRGGPPEPQVVRGREERGSAALLAASRSGLHAASDHFEDAVLAGVTTIGCRRCGGGMAGRAFDSNVGEALAIAERLPARLIVWEGSGSVIPPVRAQGVLCVAGAGQATEYIAGYLGTYRMLISDVIVLTMCEPPFADPARVGRLCGEIAGVNPEATVVPTVFRPLPAESVAGERVAYFTTAAPESLPGLTRHLEAEHGANVVVASADLAHRQLLAAAVERASGEADVFLTELKAAAIDVVAEAADAQGKRLVFCDNEPRPLNGADLAGAIKSLAKSCERRFEEA